MGDKTIILKSLVGSRAHGLHTPDSDYDYRGVYVLPTRDILSLGFKYSGTSWIEGEVDDTSYEVGHFLQLCTKANPSVLEVLLSKETKLDTPYAEDMRELLPLMYNPKDAFNAFAGYSKNQQKKLLEDHLSRRLKFGVAYVRTAYNLVELFESGTFSLEVTDENKKKVLFGIKHGEYSDGDIIDMAEQQIAIAKQMLPDIKNNQDLNAVNDLLIKIRKDFLA
jgi:predicted nucleotidyltransferase